MASSSKYWYKDDKDTQRGPDDVVPADNLPPPYDIWEDIVDSAVEQDDGRVLLPNLTRWESFSKTFSSDSYEDLFTPKDVAPEVSRTHAAPPSIPKLAIVIQIVGSRGDVQPYIALGKELAVHGHRVRIATHEVFRKWVRGHNMEFFPLGGDPAELMAFMVENGGLIPSAASIARGDVQKKRKAIAAILESTWRSCIDPDDETGQQFRADLIIANPPSFGHLHCAEKLGIPLHMSFTMPWTPTGSFPHPLANLDHTKSVRTGLNCMSYGATEHLTWVGLGDLVNEFRKVLKLKSLSYQQGTNAINELKVPYTYCWSPSLIPKPVDWDDHIDIAGFYFLDQASDYQPPADLAAFLANGSPPIYIGFGSVTGYDTKKLTSAVLEGVRLSGVRAIISKGWAGLGSKGDDSRLDDPNIFFIGDCPHDWLFKNVAAVCHHGGAGTLSAGLRLGKPTIVVPFFGDQFFWGTMVYRMKAGPLPIPARKMTAEKLSDAIREALHPKTVARAQQIANGMAHENGVASGVASLHAHLPLDNMRSDFNQTHPARYRVPQFNLKISHNVAQVLACAGLIKEEQLEWYQTRRWVMPDGHDQILGTGALKATYNGLTGIFTDTIKGINVAVKEGNAAESIGKGFGKGVGKAVTFPFTGRLSFGDF
ncbi:hypothetical protein BC832DRAFT_610422 [Gaertneriomyces semiglobifer]|nr:hypothetical protein BC832DRAFT_610422 [Gaertneriomyces semiglobifer]